jgi:hypothetical protein
MRLILAAALTAAVTPAFADEAPLPFTYEDFEAAVAHVDLAQCPGELAAEGRFCRVTVVNDKINVFAFTETGDQPLVAFKSWSADLLTGLMD